MTRFTLVLSASRRGVVGVALLLASLTLAQDAGRDAGVAPLALPLSPVIDQPDDMKRQPPAGPFRLGRGAGPAPAVTLGAITTRGPLAPELVRRVLRAHLGLFTHCATLHPASGKLVVGFVITPTGAVLDAKVLRSALGTAALDACIIDVLRERRFPTPTAGGPVNVEVPLEFSAR
ncbi:MAG: TonB family protein [Myxococcaceae bacterium]|jgi:TonB family protein|nr:TonB family protein [Myxococcaceae bacterium]